MPRLTLPFTELSPDNDAFGALGESIASGVLPAKGYYRPAKLPVALSSALPSRPLGAWSGKSTAGASFIIAGTADKLYYYNGNAWTEIASGFSASQDYGWQFAQYGTGLIATNGVNPVQSITLADTPTVAALGGSPPRARFVAAVREFVFLGITNDNVRDYAWSGAGRANFWTAGQSQSSTATLQRGGKITGITSGGEYALLFQEYAINLIEYTGGATIFSRSEVSAQLGCVAPGSLAQWGGLTFFLSHHGFMRMDGISPPVPIADERISREFAAESSASYYSSMTVAIDPINRVVVWTVPNATTPTKAYCYNWLLDRWTTLPVTAPLVFSGFTPASTLADVAAIYPLLSDVPEPFGSARWQGGSPAMYSFTASNELATATGANMAATMAMNEVEPAAPNRARIRLVRPQIDAVSGLTLTLNTRSRHGDAFSPATYTAVNVVGEFPVRENARFVKPQLAVAQGTPWTVCQGFELEFERGSVV